jgi:hypothetical protein
MLAIHWSPVKNTNKILKNGIHKSKRGLFCFPLTGERNYDQHWVILFNQIKYRDRKKYNGFVFRIEKEDMPAYFGYWRDYFDGDRFEHEFSDFEKFEFCYRERIIRTIGKKILKLEFSKTEEFLRKRNERITEYPSFYKSINDPVLLDEVFKDWVLHQIFEKCKGLQSFFEELEEDKIFLEKGKTELQKNQDLLKGSLHDLDLLSDAFWGWQIILSRSISPDRIIKIISNQDEYGRILHKNKKYEYNSFNVDY